MPLARTPVRACDGDSETGGKPMATNQTYVKTEVVGSSNKSVSDAIESAIATASRSLRNLDWFEVVDVRGRIREGEVANYQVTMKVGFRYEAKK